MKDNSVEAKLCTVVQVIGPVVDIESPPASSLTLDAIVIDSERSR